MASREEEIAAQKWLDETLSRARAVVEEHPLGPKDQPWEVYEARMRGMVAAALRSTDGYLGLTLEAAHERARTLRDELCVHRGPTGHRSSYSSARVHITFGADERVSAAELDRPPPWGGPPADPAQGVGD